MKKVIMNVNIATILVCFLFSYNVFAGIGVKGSLTREYSVSPGETIRGTIIIQNTGRTAAKAKIYLRDYTFNCEGSSFYDEPGTVERSNAIFRASLRELMC